MATVTQPTFMPTNKLTAAMLAGGAYEFVRSVVVRGIEAVGVWLGIPWSLDVNSDLLLQFAIMALVGYLVKDRPNTTLPGKSE